MSKYPLLLFGAEYKKESEEEGRKPLRFVMGSSAQIVL